MPASSKSRSPTAGTSSSPARSPRRWGFDMAARTPSQTIGPFFHLGLRWPEGGRVGSAAKGPPIVLTGRITDGAGDAVDDALFEASQPSSIARVETQPGGTF